MKTLYHIQVARAAFEPYLTPRALDWLIRGNFNTDFYGTLGWKILQYKVLPLYPAANHWYHPIDHLDMCRDFASLKKDWNEMTQRMAACADDTLYPIKSVKKIMIALGRSSHSLTDVYAHSNYMELLYEYFRNEAVPAEAVKKSGLPLPEYIGKHAPLFSEITNGARGRYEIFLNKYVTPKIFTDECLPDEGPKSHEEINKDHPLCKRAQSQEYPDIFKQTMKLAHRDICGVVKNFFDNLKKTNPAKFDAISHAFPGDAKSPGVFERRAKYWSAKFGAYE